MVLLPLYAVKAQQTPSPDPFAGNLFPPELIMQHQDALGLSEVQKTFFKAELSKTQTRLTELQWDLQAEVSKLAASVKPNYVDDATTLHYLDSVLAIEREIKRMHIGLLVRVKNKLTPEQQVQLREIVIKTKE